MDKWNLNWNNSSNDKWNIDWSKGKTQQEIVGEEKQERISQGLPVSVRKDRATPTMGGSLIRGVVTPVVDVASNLLGGTDLSNKYLGKVEGLGKIDITKSPFAKENLKTIKRSALTGLEIGSYLTGGGAVVGAGKQAVKQTAKEFLKTSGKQLAKEGAITGGLGSVGYQGRDGKIDPLTVIRDTAIGAIAAPLLGAGFNKLLGKKTSKVVDEIIPTQKIPTVVDKIDNIADNSLSKNTTGIKKGTTTFLKENPQEIANREVRLREVDGKVVIEDGRHTLQAAKETGITPIFKDVTSEYTGTPSRKIEDIINNKTIQTIPEQQTISNVAPEIIEKDIQSFKKNIPNVEDFEEGTFKEWSNILRNMNKAELENVALGGEKTIPNNIPKTAYYATLKEVAKETGDVDLAVRLSNSPIPSKSGQEFGANQMSASDNIVDDLVAIKKSRAKQKGLSDTRYNEEADTILKSIKARIEKMKNTIPTQQEIDDVINRLICK